MGEDYKVQVTLSPETFEHVLRHAGATGKSIEEYLASFIEFGCCRAKEVRILHDAAMVRESVR